MDTPTERNTNSFDTASQIPNWGAVTEDVVIPVIEETVQSSKRVVETGRFRIAKTVHQEEQLVNLPLSHEEVSVEHVPINEYVDVPPAIRYEGDTTVYPVLKEVLVIEKKLVLVEEVHVTKRLVTTNERQSVIIRKEEISVDRMPSDPERSA